MAKLKRLRQYIIGENMRKIVSGNVRFWHSLEINLAVFHEINNWYTIESAVSFLVMNLLGRKSQEEIKLFEGT